MREVHDLASGMKDAIAKIKQAAQDAKSSLHAEIGRAQVNASKVVAMTSDLKAANLEVESFLGETGSNFPEAGEDSSIPTAKSDRNGVSLNPIAPK